jgi:hypothetical protein
MFLCNNCQPMPFFWYTFTLGWLVDPVVTLLVSATADTVLLFCPTSTAHSRCIEDAHTILGFLLSADPSRFQLFSISIKCGRSILSFPSLSTHFYQPIYRLRDRLYIYRSYTLNHTPIGCTSLNSCADVIESIQPHLVT